MEPISAAIGIGSLASGIFSGLSAKKGQERANSQQMAFNAEEADKQRIWEEHMFRKRFQHTREDLEAAGYNPLLAVGMSPSTPAGAAAHAEPKSTTEQSSKIFSNTAKEAMSTSLLKLTADKVKSEAASARALARMHMQEADIATSPGGKKLAAWRYFLDKSGVGRGAQNLVNAFSAGKIAKNFLSRGRDRFDKDGYIIPERPRITRSRRYRDE